MAAWDWQCKTLLVGKNSTQPQILMNHKNYSCRILHKNSSAIRSILAEHESPPFSPSSHYILLLAFIESFFIPHPSFISVQRLNGVEIGPKQGSPLATQYPRLTRFAPFSARTLAYPKKTGRLCAHAHARARAYSQSQNSIGIYVVHGVNEGIYLCSRSPLFRWAGGRCRLSLAQLLFVTSPWRFYVSSVILY